MNKKSIRYCPRCKVYTFKEICKFCNEKTVLNIPPKFSPEDKWGKYRREMKKYLNMLDVYRNYDYNKIEY